ncbi:hypothetical protein B0J14DRAFT_314107 [Halenospora varia]|nr:hypothetical protein B0J14DRAFT_314107 [Halenospora varia]
MFRHSQSVFLRSSPGLSLLHHPLPLNPQESQKLLNLLTTSFRKHLDNEHGPLRSESHTSAQPSPTLKQSHPHRRNKYDHSSETAHTRTNSFSEINKRSGLADQHLQSLLTSPLLLPPKSAKNTTENVRDPMDVFERAVANGMMDLKKATACLRKKKQLLLESSPLTIAKAMKESGAGLKVLRWLSSTNALQKLHFLQDSDFTGELMKFIVAEELQSVAWTWIQRDIKHIDRISAVELVAQPQHQYFKKSEFRPSRPSLCLPLSELVEAEVLMNDSLDSAYVCLLTADQYIRSQHQPLRQRVQEMILEPIYSSLVNKTLRMNSWGRAHSPLARPASTEANFERFLGMATIVDHGMDGRRQLDLTRAHLLLCHPTRPDAKLALRALNSNMAPSQSRDKAHKQWHDIATVRLGLHAASFLLTHEQYSEADSVMKYLRQNHAKQLGEVQRPKEHRLMNSIEAETTSLEMLEDISLA